MANWLKVNKANIEMSNGFLTYQTAIINLDAATCFALQSPGSVTVYIEGKGYVVQQQFDSAAFQTVLDYIQARTQGKKLP